LKERRRKIFNSTRAKEGTPDATSAVRRRQIKVLLGKKYLFRIIYPGLAQFG
jgi:hypothetical protein